MEAKELSIRKCIQWLEHACKCRDADCRLPNCQKMKRVVQHTKICRREASGDCVFCKQVVALSCHHAKYCQEAICPVAFCQSTKYKMKQQQLYSRQMAVMNTLRSVAVSPGAPQTLPVPEPPHQPGIGPAQTPSASVLQAQEETACQQASLAAVGKVNPAVPQVMPPPQGLSTGPAAGPTTLPSMDQCPNDTSRQLGCSKPISRYCKVLRDL